MAEREDAGSPWVVYLLRCRGDRLYCGVTTDLDERFAAHAAGTGAKFTRAFPPIAIEASVVVAGRAEALRLEARIKRLPREQKRHALVQAQPPCASSDQRAPIGPVSAIHSPSGTGRPKK